MGKPASLRKSFQRSIPVALVTMALVMVAMSASAEDFPPTVYVYIDEPDTYQTVDVSIGQAVALVRGLIEVEKDSILPETIKVTIEGTPWDGTVTEITEQVSGTHDSFRFSLRMTIPSGEAEGVYGGQVTAVWTSSTDQRYEWTDDFQVRVVNTPFTVDVNPVYQVAEAGDIKYVTITIHDRSLTGQDYLVQVGEVTSPEPGEWIRWVQAWLDASRIYVRAGESETLTLEVEVPANATDGTLDIPVVISVDGHPEYTRQMDVVVYVSGVPFEPPAPPTDDPLLDIDPMLLFTIVMVVAAVGFIGFIGFTEVGLLFIMWGLLMPLFTRLRKEEVLNQFTRGEIYGFIKANPGVHLTSIKENLGLANGVLAYHLKVLIREEFIVAKREGGYKRFYPRDMRVPRKRVHFTRLQLDIVERLSLHPGTTQASLARMLGESKQVINYNVGVLVAAGVIRVEREGSKTLLFVEDATALRPQVQVAELVEEGAEDDDAGAKGTPTPLRFQ
ncbi:MAG: winged helix-turn-helix transcriptional regulator [Thermoplasmata archaeon]|nr:MAG: winged helix-turn-helix transcriptional regulator [Thermoplasmata archaeon]